jgi:tetratricopeptide (TPR) repeat protein
MRIVPALLLFLAALPLSAAIELPQVSPGATVTQALGVSKVTATFHRPAVKGRKVWGELVPFDKVWRLGANDATTLELSHDAKVNGTSVPAGRYALFAIPGQAEWTLILNKTHKQWGSYFYDQKADALRFAVKPETAPEPREYFDIALVPTGERTMRVEIEWERVRVPFTIEFDVQGIVWKNIETALATSPDWETWHQAARYALTSGQRLDDAMGWIEKAMTTENFWNYELKALLLQKLGRTDEAFPLMEKAKELAKGKAPQEYIDGLDKTVAGWKSAPR